MLKDHGIGINDAVNGVFLPRFTSSPNPAGSAVHASVHGDRYYAEVNSIVLAARSSKEDVIEALLLIKLALLDDIFAK